VIRSHRRLWYLDSPPYPQHVQFCAECLRVSTYILVGARFCLKVVVESKHANPSVKRGPKRGKNWCREGYPRLMNSSFSGLLHFATDRTLSGWALLFRMGKHTSEDFLHGGIDTRIFKARETLSKTRSKSWSKHVPTSTPITGKLDIHANRLSSGASKRVQNRAQK
jgi:hypothetical protein